ncbi:MAG TPA: PAS domain S-box protein, partial [Syntrophorhabdaceae bacterium]|nr:PAS domain S-box protein [Syntrophorhabdaceae bacterium]
LKQRIRELEQSEINRGQTEKALQESKEKFRQLIENSHDIIYSLSPEGVVTYVSPSCTTLLGYGVAQIIGKPFQQFIHPEDAGEVGRLLKEIMEAGRRQDVVQYRLKHMDGSYTWYMSRGNPVRDEKGVFIGYQGITRDITELKLTEQALKESNELFSLFIHHSPIYSFIKEVTPTQSIVLQASDNYRQLIGIPGCEMIGKTMEELFPPDFAKKITADDCRIVSSGSVERLDEEFENRNYHTFKFPIVMGNKTLLAGYTIDTTELQHVEQALKESEFRLKRLYQESPIPTFTWQRKEGDFILVDYNHAAIKLRDRTDGYHLGTSALEYFRHMPQILKDMELCYTGKSVVINEIISQDFAPGKYFSMHYGFITPDLIIIHVEDITDRKRTEKILQARLRLAEASHSSSLEKLMQAVLDEICTLVDSPIGFFHFIEDDERTVSLQTWSTFTLEKMCTLESKGRHYNVNEAGVWVECINRRCPVIHNDYVGLQHRKGLPAGHAPVIREMIIPIFRNRKIVAIIGVGNKAKDYTQD